MENTSTTTHIGLAVVLSNESPVNSTKHLVKAIDIQSKELISLWFDLKQDIKLGASIGYLAETKSVPSRLDPRKQEDRTFFEMIPTEGVEAFNALCNA